MAFQTRDLVVSAVGMTSATPTLLGPGPVDGVHVRWALARGRGFPWGGFHLLRRPHVRREPVCLRRHLSETGRTPGPLGTTVLPVPGLGVLVGDHGLHLKEDQGRLVVVLEDGARLRLQLPPGEPAHLATVHLLPSEPGTVRATARSFDVPVAAEDLTGQPGQALTAELAFDAITAVDLELEGGPAVLADLCVFPVTDGAEEDWEPVPGVPQPLCLPVAEPAAHPTYPTPDGASNVAEAREVALGRVAGDGTGPSDPAAVDFDELHEQLTVLVARPPQEQGPMASLVERVIDASASEQAGMDVAMQQRALDLVLLAAIDPTAAQMVGLYWVDQRVAPRAAYDYLVIADHDGAEHGALLEAVLGGTHPRDLPDADSWITFDHGGVASPSPPAPQDVQLFVLPDAGGRSRGGGDGPDPELNRVGVRWDRGEGRPGAPGPHQPALYQLSRATLGLTEPLQGPSDDDYAPVHDRPIVLARPVDPPAEPPRPEGWPHLRLYAVDDGLDNGWYAYRVRGIDLFGRASAPSEPGVWRQWTPPADPPPWYHQGSVGDGVVHPSAVCLLDTTPPPPPIELRAEALDPAADDDWKRRLDERGLDPLVGLRVRWTWTAAHARQAPDLREFRIHFQPGGLNVVEATAETVADAGDGESLVTTDLDNDLPADAFAGGSAQIGGRGFPILGSEPGTPLVLRVGNRGEDHDVQPTAGKPCAITLRAGHPHHRDFQRADAWAERRRMVGYDEHVEVDTDDAGEEVRHYELTLPLPDDVDPEGLPLAASLAEPIVYGHVGVSAVRELPAGVPDQAPPGAPPWQDPGAFDTEGPVSRPATVYVVLRGAPDPPQAPPADGDQRYASPADYHGHSYVTVRWVHEPFHTALVYRALDESVHLADRAERAKQPRGTLAPDDPALAHAFPPEWDDDRRASVAAELEALDAVVAGEDADEIVAAYEGLTNDGLRLLAALPGNDRAFTQRTSTPLDPDDPATADRWGPDDPGAPDDHQPDADLRAYVDELDGRTRSRYLYRTALIDPAGNRSALGPASPPVATPKVTPPSPPTVTKVTGGDRQVTLTWRHPAGTDAVEYRLYRADDRTSAADLRTMRHIAAVDATGDGPALIDQAADGSAAEPTVVAPPGGLLAAAVPAPGLVQRWYRLAAVDAVGNVSRPSPAVPAKAYDESLPEVPDLTVSWEGDDSSTHAMLSWDAPDGIDTRVQHRVGTTGPWNDLTPWRSPAVAHTFVHDDADPTQDHQYRLWARKATGAVERGPGVDLPAATA